MTDPDKPAVTPRESAMEACLTHAALLIASFNWKLAQAGYPFRPPPDVSRILTEIDGLLYPDDPIRKRKTGKARVGA